MEELSGPASTQQVGSSLHLDGLINTLAEKSTAVAMSPLERLSASNRPSTGRYLRAQQRMLMRLCSDRNLLSIPPLSADNLECPEADTSNHGRYVIGSPTGIRATLTIHPNAFSASSADEETVLQRRGGNGLNLPPLDGSQHSAAPTPRHVPSPVVVPPPRSDGFAKLFEKRQWTRPPPVVSKEEEAAQVYEQRLEHFFPCIPTDKPATSPRPAQLLCSMRS